MSHVSWDVCACLSMLIDLQENCRGSHRGASVAVGMVKLLKVLETIGDTRYPCTFWEALHGNTRVQVRVPTLSGSALGWPKGGNLRWQAKGPTGLTLFSAGAAFQGPVLTLLVSPSPAAAPPEGENGSYSRQKPQREGGPRVDPKESGCE